jgi:hypothetical protein
MICPECVSAVLIEDFQANRRLYCQAIMRDIPWRVVKCSRFQNKNEVIAMLVDEKVGVVVEPENPKRKGWPKGRKRKIG